MMRGVNKHTVLGRIGNKPEVRYTRSQKPVISISVATTELYNDQQGQRQEITDWHNVVIWGKRAETVAQYLTKGDQIYVEGKSRKREWTDDDNTKRHVTEIIVDNDGVMQMIGTKDRPSQSI